MDSMKTFRVRMELYKGESDGAVEWLETTPNSTVFFSILDRYIYVSKVRVLIILKRYEEALSLIERLLVVFENYNRDYYWIQTQLLKAILFYRAGRDDWKAPLEAALKKAEYFGYIRLFADEGFALQLLLQDFDSDEIDSEYLSKIKEQTENMAVFYPNYMKTVEMIDEPLTEMEHKVIRLMCSEMTSEDICSMLHISYSGLKFHKANIYRKFGVTNRQEAQRKAKSLGLNLQ